MLTISAGHYGKGTGASSLLDEGQEVIRVVEALQKNLQQTTLEVSYLIDRQSKTKQQNLAYLVKAHNATRRTLDVSIHFNAVSEQTDRAIGTEVLYVNPSIQSFAQTMSTAIANAGKFKNRGAKKRTDLAFLNGTSKPAILIEICFINSAEDVKLYQQNFPAIIAAICQQFVQYFSVERRGFSSPTLEKKVAALFSDKAVIRQQLEQGVKEGAFQAIWLDKFERNELTLHDYLGLSTLQLKKYTMNV